ncbi:MAG: hypothetical protein ACHP84_04635 [Caulobacterales bacterium]
MRPAKLGLAAVLIAALTCIGAFAAPASASAAAAAAVKPTDIPKEKRAQGMKEAPAVAQSAGLPCTVTDARFIGEAKDDKAKTDSKYYEVACKEGLGFDVVGHAPGVAPDWTDCVSETPTQADGKPNALFCELPANLDLKGMLAPFVAKAGTPCAILNQRGIGHNSTTSVYEVACSGGSGYILKTSSPPNLSSPASMITCLAFDPTNTVSCKLTTTAVALAAVDTLAGQSGKDCQVKDRRYILTTNDGSNYYEVACQNGKGYVLVQAAAGALTRTIDCADADFVAGGCTLTNARQAQVEEAKLYSRLARNAGFQCDVSKYAVFPTNTPGKETVELTCSNRSDGAIAIFPAVETSPAEIYDCAHSELVGYRCAFSPASAAYPKLTDDLKSLGKTSCTVTNARVVNVRVDGKGLIEVGCADGNPGFVIEYSLAPLKPASVLNCSEAKEIEGGCKLPNVKS